MDKMDLLETFARVAELRSISKAADELDVAQSTVSRKLQKLEKLVGQTLVNRSVNATSLTEIGNRFLDEARELISRWQALEDRYQGAEDAMNGPIKIVAPVGMGQHFLVDIATEFHAQNPGVEITWILQNEVVDFAEAGCDLWLRTGEIPEDRLIQRNLAIAQRRLVATPKVVEGIALRGPSSVNKLPCVALNAREGGIIELTSSRSHASVTIYPDVVFATDNFFVLHKALISGRGFGVMPDWFIQADLKSGSLIEILPEWTAPPLTLRAITAKSQYQNQRVEAFIRYLSSRLIDIPGLRMIAAPEVIAIG